MEAHLIQQLIALFVILGPKILHDLSKWEHILVCPEQTHA